MYQFTKDCLIGIEEIDKEHEELFRLINEAQKIYEEGTVTPQVVKNIVEHLKDYARRHFDHEEAYMEKIKDPELASQRKEHADFVKKISGIDYENMTDEKSREMLTAIVQFLAKWLYKHILGSDIMIGKMPEIKRAESEIVMEKEEKNSMFAFKDEYKTNIAIVDAEHQKLFEIIEETYNLIHEEFVPDKYDNIVAIIEQLKEYTQVHFKDEEAYMENIGYEGLALQQMAHEAFISRLAEINMDEVDDSQEEYLYELIDFLLEWLKNHILKMDKQIPAE